MGYKRMKKRKVTEYDTFLSAARKAYCEMQGLLGIKYVVPDGWPGISSLLFANGKVYERGDVDGRMKWFESPNAEGYLDM